MSGMVLGPSSVMVLYLDPLDFDAMLLLYDPQRV